MKTIKVRFDGRVFVPEEPIDLPIGFEGEVRVPSSDRAEETGAAGQPSGTDSVRDEHSADVSDASGSSAAPKRTFAELLKLLEQLPANDDWPEDGAIQHDHYLYGTPKRTNP